MTSTVTSIERDSRVEAPKEKIMTHFTVAQTPDTNSAMTPQHPRWAEFIARLRGPAGLQHARCAHDLDHSLKILGGMGAIHLAASLHYFQQHGIACDCTVVMKLGSGGDVRASASPATLGWEHRCPEAILATLGALLPQLRLEATDPSAMAAADVTVGVYPDRDKEDATIRKVESALQDAIGGLITQAGTSLTLARARRVGQVGLVMNPRHPRWAEFITLVGVVLEGGICQDDYRHCTRVLTEMGGMDIAASLEFFEWHFGCCDCEVVGNMGLEVELNSLDSEDDSEGTADVGGVDLTHAHRNEGEWPMVGPTGPVMR
jgi:hypothetical protein